MSNIRSLVRPTGTTAWMEHERTTPLVDVAVLRQFDPAGPRHTAYPPTDRFVEAFGPDDHASWMKKRGIGGFARKLGLYVHIPPFTKVCSHCGRSGTGSTDPDTYSRYLAQLEKEVRLQSGLLDERSVVQVRWGGGTDALLGSGRFAHVASTIGRHFDTSQLAEFSIEVGPQGVDRESVGQLSRAGANGLSLTVCGCDFGGHPCGGDTDRILDAVSSVAAVARENNINSISLDVVFGTPGQTVMSFNRMLRTLLALSPARVSLRNYAWLPGTARGHRKSDQGALSDEETRIQLFALAVMRLAQADYVHIGMEQFARPDDSLAVAQRQGRLHHNYQGYLTYADCDLLGLGMAAISAVGPTYSQNARMLKGYCERLEQDILPVARGVELTADDLVRRTVMHALLCHHEIAFEAVEIAHLVDFKRYFSQELEDLKLLADAGLVTLDDNWLCITDRGRYVVRAVCRVFDRYLRQERKRASFEKVL